MARLSCTVAVVKTDVRTKFALVVHASMQFKPVMLTLPVVAGVGVASSHMVVFSSHKSTDFEHGGVHEAKLCLRRKDTIQDISNLRYNPVTMFEKVLVFRQVRKVTLVVLDNSVVDLANSLLLRSEQVEYQDSNDLAVTEYGLTATAHRLYG
jgi:hypothetical protein